jgi:hypothetical protein
VESQAKGDFARRNGESRKGPITVADYANRWVEDRKQLGLATASDDLARLRLHVLPTPGGMALEDVRPRQIRDLVLALRKQDVLAPRSIRHVYAVAACMFRTAVADELIPIHALRARERHPPVKAKPSALSAAERDPLTFRRPAERRDEWCSSPWLCQQGNVRVPGRPTRAFTPYRPGKGGIRWKAEQLAR